MNTNTTSPVYLYDFSKPNRNDNKNHNFISFIVDTGATEHITNSRNIFDRLDQSEFNLIKCANKDSKDDLIVNGKGRVYLISNNNKTIKFEKVIYTESVSENLLSLRRLAEAGYSTFMNDKSINVFDSKTKKLFEQGFMKDSIGSLNLKLIRMYVMMSSLSQI